MRTYPIVVGLALVLAGPALAASESAKMQGQDQNANAPATTTTHSAKMQGTNQTEQKENQGGQNQSEQAIGQQLATDLEQAGFTDVKIMPRSFLVRAKDKNGNPVMMVINPDSVAAVTEENNQSEKKPGSSE
jgi:hypothetical protein